MDSFALHKDQRHSRNGPGLSTHYSQRPETSIATPQYPVQNYQTHSGTYETTTPVAGYPTGVNNGERIVADPTAGEVVAPTEYPYRAKAIYSYEANPDDANEISFSKHEILEVSDVSGRWWQAKKENGDTGIAPSKYLILL